MRSPVKGAVLGAVLLLGSALLLSTAWAEEKNTSREREALRRVQQQLQQARQEQAALEEKLNTAAAESAARVQEKDKELGLAETRAQERAKADAGRRQKLQAALDAANAEKQTLQTQKTELEQKLRELGTKLAGTERELAQTLQQITALKKRADTLQAAQQQQVASCEDKNLQLYQYGRSLIDQCKDRSRTDAVLRIEPFTGIKRVGIENLLEEYRDKLDSQKIIAQEPRP
jgi:DNA repair exonuclease SbcCD ATPase subunit